MRPYITLIASWEDVGEMENPTAREYAKQNGRKFTWAVGDHALYYHSDSQVNGMVIGYDGPPLPAGASATDSQYAEIIDKAAAQNLLGEFALRGAAYISEISKTKVPVATLNP